MAQLTPRQQQLLRMADRQGRSLVTVIDDRVAVILPPQSGGEEIADYLQRVMLALQSAKLA